MIGRDYTPGNPASDMFIRKGASAV